MKRLSATAILFLALTGCVTAPPIPAYNVSHGERVGILVEVGKQQTHTHIGTTVFNNFEKTYEYNWRIEDVVISNFKGELEKSGLEPVLVAPAGVTYEQVKGLINVTGEKWAVSPDRAETFRKLKNDLRLRAIVVVKEQRTLAALECSGGPCSERYVDRSGLYTRSVFGSSTYLAVAALSTNLYLLDPVADLARGERLRNIHRYSSRATVLKDFRKPKNFKNLSEEELKPVKEAIEKNITTLAVAVRRALLQQE